MIDVTTNVEAAFIYGMAEEEYHAMEALSSTGSKMILRSPAHFQAWRYRPPDDTEAKRIGKAIHVGVLEPHRFVRDVVVCPPFNRRTNAGKEEAACWEKENEGKIVLTESEMVNVQCIIGSVVSHPAVKLLLENEGKYEAVACWHEGDVRMKSRFDFLVPESGFGIIDLKSCIDASPAGFAQSMAKWGYALQASTYRRAVRAVTGEWPGFFVFVAVEKTDPWACAVYEIDEASIEAGDRMLDSAIDRYRRCMDAGHWPAYAPTITRVGLPVWALNRTWDE